MTADVMINQHLYFSENPLADPLLENVTYTMTQFSKVASKRYNVPYYRLRRWISEYGDGVTGIHVDESGKAKRYYVGTEFIRLFEHYVIPELRKGRHFKDIVTPFKD